MPNSSNKENSLESYRFDNAPSHLFSIAELDHSKALSSRLYDGVWFRLATWTHGYTHDSLGIETTISRQSSLLAPNSFAEVFPHLDSIGDVLFNMGRPSGSIRNTTGEEVYSYLPFYKVEIGNDLASGEPLVFSLENSSDRRLFINPDITLFFDLRENKPGSGIWWDPRSSTEAMIHGKSDDEIEYVDIRSNFLRRYLSARQMSLVVGHYCHKHYYNPSYEAVKSFVAGDIILGSAKEQAKAVFQNWGLRKDVGREFLQRRLHLWFEIKPSPIDIKDPWAEDPPFDIYQFTFPTCHGPVAPGRWAGAKFKSDSNDKFSGNTCDFMHRIFFRQEALSRYETTSGYIVEDDGSIRCQHYWALNRSVMRHGNDLLSTAIGDFAEGVPLSEWEHWQRYAAPPPNIDTLQLIQEERTICVAINELLEELTWLNRAFNSFGSALSAIDTKPLWEGSSDGLACRQLKWNYPSGTNEDEFVKRATLTSTLVIEGFKPDALRKILNLIGKDLHLSKDNPPKSLGSRKLLERINVISIIISKLKPQHSEIAILLHQAEMGHINQEHLDLDEELRGIWLQSRTDFSPLAFLYDLRNFGGIAHLPDIKKFSAATSQLGLPEKNWQRQDFIFLIELVCSSIKAARSNLFQAVSIIQYGM
jgi:hypothetical protein